MKAIKSDSDSDSDEQKRSPGFSGKNRGVTPSVASPGVTRPSDATEHKRNGVPVPALIYCSSKGECGRLPGYIRSRVIPRRGRCFCLV